MNLGMQWHKILLPEAEAVPGCIKRLVDVAALLSDGRGRKQAPQMKS